MAEAAPCPSLGTPKERRQRNQDMSLIIKCPPEILKLLAMHLHHPIDLKNFTHTCHSFYHLIERRDWYNIFLHGYPKWSDGCGFEEVLDWRRTLLQNAGLNRRLAAPLPPVLDSSMDIDPPTTGSTSTTIPPNSAGGQAHMRPRLLLEEATVYSSDAATAQSDWRRTGSPVYHIDEHSKTVISASMVMRPTTNGGNWLDDHQILLYTMPDLTNPLAILTSDFWTREREDHLAWNHPHEDNSALTVAQIMDIRHYPSVIQDGEMRVVMVVAFGENARPITPDQEDVHVLDVWLIIRIIEIWLPVPPNSALTSHSETQIWSKHSSAAQTPIVTPRLGRIETIEPSQRQNYMRGRIAKLYVAKAPKIARGAKHDGEWSGGSRGEEEYDCITLFGMLQSENSPALVIKKILFLDDREQGDASWSKKQISRGVSCMTLFPNNSSVERFLVLFNRHGRGMIWDWVGEKQVAQLHLPIDKPKDLSEEQVKKATAAAALPRNIFYWGVQVSWAVEVPSLPAAKGRRRSGFRVVILADGNENEWESRWWHVNSADLGPDSETDLEAPPFKMLEQKDHPSASPAKTLYASSLQYEKETIGYCLPEQRAANQAEDGQPLRFVAFVIWNHLRITLTAQLGLTIVDMDEEGTAVRSGADADKGREWVVFLDGVEENPLVDIATVGNHLVITRRSGHIVWPFYRSQP